MKTRAKAFAAALALGCGSAAGQTTFQVTVGFKTQAHPYFGMGHMESYRIDGVEGAVVEFERGVEYVFQMAGVPLDHPFYISTDPAGGFGFIGEWTDGVVGSGATGNGQLRFTPGPTAPAELFYQCGLHDRMGYRIEIVDPCYPDCDGDGALDFFDFLCFQNAFLAQEPYADCDENGVFDFFDFLCFQNAFLAGCP
jgi:hypothetical protein